MKLFHYWASAQKTMKTAKGQNIFLKRWGASNESLEDAQTKAQALLAQTIEKFEQTPFKKGNVERSTNEYHYATDGSPEEVIGEIHETHGVTRNRLGCLVLNTTNALFIDIDLPSYGFISKLFKRPNPENVFIKTLEAWITSHEGFGVRIYRTAGGLRYLVTHAPFSADEQVLDWMKELGSDPLYIKLCKTQGCFRARLTPKHWRIGIKDRPNYFPRLTQASKQAFQKWLQHYENESRKFATCSFIKTIGSKNICEEVENIVREHDRQTKANMTLPLA